jgi:hypothetical protein
MSLRGRFYAGDEELGKKDDDHRRSGSSVMSKPTAQIFTWRGPRRKRILLALAVFSVLYLFFKNLPNDSITAAHRQGSRLHNPASPPSSISPPKGAPPRSESSVDTRHYFEGPIKFYNLASSWASGLGPVRDRRNVLFVVASLKSAASLLPLACDMSKQNKNRVHLMLAGRDAMSTEDIQKINGVTEADCSVKWHDGRPDFSIYSTDYRMEVSARAALGHIRPVMMPRAVLIDSENREDAFLIRAMRDKTKELGLPLIELPVNAAENLKWISKLDGSSLTEWNDISVEIFIHAPPESSGSLIRLLKSIQNADYFGSPLPRITIELPNHIDAPTSRFLGSFRWPPKSEAGSSKLILRHRLLSKHLDSTQASLRQIESFYPSNVPQSNILVLSPQVELSPQYFHYLVYALLEYKHSNTALHTSDSLLGVSLERPTTTLNDRDSFAIATEASSKPFFLSQSPNSNAALYFGDKWVELHSFLSNRLAVDKFVQKPTSETLAYISHQHPSWLAYILELSRARAYTMLYPSLSESIATMHTELYQAPDEYREHSSSHFDAETKPHSSTPLTAEFTPHPETPPLSGAAASRSILHILNPTLPTTDSGGPLPDLSTLPILSYKGEYLEQGQIPLNQASIAFSEAFAKEFGSCKDGSKRPKRKAWSADDLFCLDDSLMEKELGVGERPSANVGEEFVREVTQAANVGQKGAGR